MIFKWLNRLFSPEIEFDMSLGTVADFRNTPDQDTVELRISPETFAPGIWAGMEKTPIKVGNQDFLVLAVDFQKRTLICEGFCSADIIGKEIHYWGY